MESIKHIIKCLVITSVIGFFLFIGHEMVGGAKTSALLDDAITYSSVAFVPFDQVRDFLDLLASVKYNDLETMQMLLRETRDEHIAGSQLGLLFQAFVIGCILIIGMNQLVFYFSRKKVLSSLYVALACFAIVTRIFFIKETLFANLFYDFSAETILTMDMVTAFLAIIFYLNYLNREFIVPTYHIYTKILCGVITLYIACIILLPLNIILETNYLYPITAFVALIYIITFSVLAVLRKVPGSNMNLSGILVLFLLAWNDIIDIDINISPNEIRSFSLLIYVLLMSIHLSQKSSHSFARVENLSEELLELNVLLESKVEKRTEELYEKNEALKKVETSRRRLLASVSHELNTPLTFIHGYIRAMLDGVVPKDDASYLRAVYQDTEMMARMIGDLQELSQLESGYFHFEWRDVDIGIYLKNVFLEQQPIFLERKINYTYNEIRYTQEHSLTCTIDPTRLKQVFKNLLVNANKFTPEEGEVSIEVELPSQKNKEMVKVKIHDTGIGIASEEIPYVFERLYKANRSDVGKGSGLGLAISKEIIENHGGEIGVTSKLNEGSIFYFTLPIKGCHPNEKEKNHINRRG